MERKTEEQARQLVADAEAENHLILHSQLRESLVTPLVTGSAQTQALYSVVDALGRVTRSGEPAAVLAPKPAR